MNGALNSWRVQSVRLAYNTWAENAASEGAARALATKVAGALIHREGRKIVAYLGGGG